MTIEVDRGSFMRSLDARAGYDVSVAFTPAAGSDSGETVAALTRAVAEANDPPGQELGVRGTIAAPALDLAITFIAKAHDQAPLFGWVERVADALTQAGWSGQLSSYETPEPVAGSPAQPPPRRVEMVSLLFTRGWTTREETPHRVAAAGWLSDTKLRDALVDLVDSWLPPEGWFTGTSMSTTWRLQRHQVATQVSNSLTIDRPVYLTCASDGQSLDIKFEPRGRISVVDTGNPLPATERLRLHSGRIGQAAPWCESALVRHVVTGSSGTGDVLNVAPCPPYNHTDPRQRTDGDTTNYYAKYRHQDTTHVPDAYPAQLLGPGHLAGLSRPLPAERWKQEHLGDGMTLVTAVDPGLWLRGVGIDIPRGKPLSRAIEDLDPNELVDTATLTTARQDFNGIILYGSNPPP